MQRVRAWTALVVLFLFPFVVAALVVGITVLCALAAMENRVLGRGIGQLLVVPLVIAIVAASKDALRARPRPSEGPLLTRADQPQLWLVVDQLAGLVQTKAPDRIVLTADVNAAVHEVSGSRELLLGLPLLAGLTVGEFRAVLAHELGHFAGGDTRVLARTMRARMFLDTLRANAGALIRWFFTLYYRLFVMASAASSRDVEIRADRYSAQAAGPRVAADALSAVGRIQLAWELVLEERVTMFAQAQARAPMHEALTRALHAHAGALEHASTQALQQERLRWDDTHPPTMVRIATLTAMGAADPGSATRDDRLATTLLGGPQELAELEAGLLATAWPLTSWDEVASRAALTTLPQRLDQMLLALHEQGAIQQPAPDHLLYALRVDPLSIGRHLTAQPDLAAEAARYAAEVAVQGLIARIPGVRAVIDPDDNLVLLDPAGRPLETREIAAGADSGALQETLAGLGAPLSLPADRANLPVAEWESVVLGAYTMTLVKQPRRQLRDMLICTDGLLFVPLKVTMGVRLATKQGQRERIEALARRLPELRADSANEWIPEETIAAVQLRILRSRLLITKVDGSTVRVELANGFEDIELLTRNSLAALFGSRLESSMSVRG